MGAGILHRVFANVGRVSYLFRMGFSRFFFSSLPSNLQQKLGSRKKESIVELGRNLIVFWFWIRSLPWLLGGPSKRLSG